jgi:hypothetical protein
MGNTHSRGSAPTKFLALLIYVIIGFLCFLTLADMIPAGVKPVIPWAMIAILLLPITFNFQALSKLRDVRNISGINREEKKRLKYLVEGKVSKVRFIIFSLIILGILMGAGLFLFAQDPIRYKMIIPAIGGLFGYALFSVHLALSYLGECSAFETKVLDKEKSKANQKAALDRLAGKPQ